MKQEVIFKISSAIACLKSINKMNEEFLSFAKLYATSDHFETKLEFDNKRILIKCFGYYAEASPRLVNDKNDSNYVMEYVFKVLQGKNEYEVSRFYLNTHGKLMENLDTKGHICDFNHPSVGQHLCSRVLMGMINSPLFEPSIKEQK